MTTVDPQVGPRGGRLLTPPPSLECAFSPPECEAGSDEQTCACSPGGCSPGSGWTSEGSDGAFQRRVS